jgi:PAS domain S-box-containing protein
LLSFPLPETVSTAGFLQFTGSRKAAATTLLIAGLILVFLYAVQLFSFLLFHVLIEIFSVVVAFAIFMFAWNTRDKITNSSLILLGAAYLAIGALDLLHTFSYKGMGVFSDYGANTATQLWIAARYLESITLAAAPLLVTRKIAMPRALAVYGALLTLVIASIFIWPVFPTCYVEGTGLTPFKVVSEYIITAILLISLVTMAIQKKHFDDDLFRMLTVSIVFTMVSELMFTFYISVYGISNLVGHFFKLGSFILIYKAIIETGLQRPYQLLFRELSLSEKRHRHLVDTLPTGLCEIDPTFLIRYINPAGLALIGYDAEDIRNGLHLSALLDSKEQSKAQRRLDMLRHDQFIDGTEYRLRRKDGTTVEVLVNSTPIVRDGELRAIQTSLTDVTELHDLQKRLHEARKMEAVAMLAGGMAHEINNVLMGVIGGIDIIRMCAADQSLSEEDFEDVHKGCNRIADLVRLLLAYSQGGRYRTETVDLRAFIPPALSELEKTLDPKVDLDCHLDDHVPPISADPLQLELVLNEIVTNAKEAIDGAGCIHIDIQSRSVDLDQARQRAGMQPGQYIRLRVRDDGQGMDPKTLSRIFEPFFTTHFPGRGMGMAAVYGIVKNHGGWIGVDSRQGRGTTVRVYLPVAPELPQTEARRQATG